MNGQQSSASKPVYLAPKRPNITPPKSPTALQGATSAFLPRSVAPTVSISPASAGARLAAFAAGTPAQQEKAISKAPQNKYGRPDVSPPRGRQLHTSTYPAPTTLRSTTSSSIPTDTTRPSLQSRSSSTLAARHATEASRSPHRSPSKSWDAEINSTSSMRQKKWSVQRTDALAGATASMAGRSAGRPAQIEPQLVKSKVINFEKLPILTSPERSIALDGSGDKNITAMKAQPTRISSVADPCTNFGRPDEKKLPVHGTTGKPDAPADVVRQLSEESTITIATTNTEDFSKSEEFLGRDRLSISASSPSRPSFTKSPPQVPAGGHNNYRKRMTVNALADAMVASSLASSRASSPNKRPLPPAARRRSRSVTALYEVSSYLTTDNDRKPPKAARPMKHTLRKPAISEDEGTGLAKRGRRHWMRKHPNMHSEGDRKRWRDKVTDPERKRYEGVFAANRGLLIGPGYFEPSPSALSDNKTVGNQVVNVVVRDIWERSRLPREVLKEIYDLVSPEEAHALNREQFVVGLWLIDQRLKGRKLPIKVSTSVWASVRLSQGIKIKKH